jgi:hypothetical protein
MELLLVNILNNFKGNIMKLKQYINEKNNSSDNILGKIRDNDIPLSPKTLERIFEIKNMEYYHLTDLSNKEKLKKLQGKRKTISCFSEWSNYDIFSGADGIDYDFEALFILKGDYTMKMPEDFYTDFDKQGRRWIQWYNIGDRNIMSLFEIISEEIIEIFEKKKFDKFTGKDIISRLKNFDLDSNFEGKLKAKIIIEYLNITEKILKKYKEDIQEVMEYETDSYDEILGYNFKITDIKMEIGTFYNYLIDDQENDFEYIEDEDFDDDDIIDDYFEKKEKQFSKNIDKYAKKMGITLYKDLDDLVWSLQ